MSPEQFAEFLIRHGAAVRSYSHEGNEECAHETHIAAAYDGRFISATFSKESGEFQEGVYQNLGTTGDRVDVPLGELQSAVEALRLPGVDASKELAA